MELICLKMPQVNFYIGQDRSYRQQLQFGHVHLNQIFNLIITRHGTSRNVLSLTVFLPQRIYSLEAISPDAASYLSVIR